jgi:hypothetical protein
MCPYLQGSAFPRFSAFVAIQRIHSLLPFTLSSHSAVVDDHAPSSIFHNAGTVALLGQT